MPQKKATAVVCNMCDESAGYLQRDKLSESGLKETLRVLLRTRGCVAVPVEGAQRHHVSKFRKSMPPGHRECTEYHTILARQANLMGLPQVCFLCDTMYTMYTMPV